MGLTQLSRLVGRQKKGDIAEVVQRDGGQEEHAADQSNLQQKRKLGKKTVQLEEQLINGTSNQGHKTSVTKGFEKRLKQI